MAFFRTKSPVSPVHKRPPLIIAGAISRDAFFWFKNHSLFLAILQHVQNGYRWTNGGFTVISISQHVTQLIGEVEVAIGKIIALNQQIPTWTKSNLSRIKKKVDSGQFVAVFLFRKLVSGQVFGIWSWKMKKNRYLCRLLLN